MTSTGTVQPGGAAATEERRLGRAFPRSKTAAPRRRGGWFAWIMLTVVCFLWLVPSIGLLVTSFRTPEAALSTGWWTVITKPFSDWTFANYTQVLEEGGRNAFVNSLVVSLPATIIPIMIAAFAAYAFTFMQFPGRDVFFILIVGLLVVPLQVALVPMLKIYGDIGLQGTFASVWLAHAAFGMPLAIFILRGYMATLPRGVIESAKIDGATHWQTFWRLIVPMSVPALASFAIFQFLWTWNDLLVALIFLGPGEKEVLTVQVAGLVGAQQQGWQLVTAGAFLSMVVPLVVFLALQRFFVRGLTAGAVKG
ncbi:MAG TPA: carbohydrate ABC transporter permease [Mycobacteriales bacterium]|nr:carbohydrate ABC transporter permease [Mycobacteriales bacterium]